MHPDMRDYDSENGVWLSASIHHSFIMSKEVYGFALNNGGFFYKGLWHIISKVIRKEPIMGGYYRLTLDL